ncbi:MAG TPA: retropepsin-like aspartic protease [Thermoanaerobaculia bacterium]|nr:retropepsin-like aspartic protease [Thermoanaerobaculia bacterium]
MTRYDDLRFAPPAPVAYVTLRKLDGSSSVEGVPMLLDTGADVSLLPRSGVERLGVRAASDEGVTLVGFDGSRTVSASVEVALLLSGRTFRGRFLLLDQDWGILGRNILNHLPLQLDGPRLSWQIVR